MIEITNRRELREYLEMDRAEAEVKKSKNKQLDKVVLVVISVLPEDISIEDRLECLLLRSAQGA